MGAEGVERKNGSQRPQSARGRRVSHQAADPQKSDQPKLTPIEPNPKIELDELITKSMITFCGGDPNLVFR